MRVFVRALMFSFFRLGSRPVSSQSRSDPTRSLLFPRGVWIVRGINAEEWWEEGERASWREHVRIGGGGMDGWTEVMKGGEGAGWTIGGEWADGVSGGSNADQQRARGGWTGGEGSDPDGKAFWQAASSPPRLARNRNGQP